jgi:hypothetical protein
LEHCRDGRLFLYRFHARKVFRPSWHQPFPERFWFNVKVKNVPGDFGHTFNLIHRFFTNNTTLTQTVSTILFYLREATKEDVHTRISTMSVCALLENMVQAVCRNEIENASSAQHLISILRDMDRKPDKHRHLSPDDPIDTLRATAFDSMERWRKEGLFRRACSLTKQNWEGTNQNLFQFWQTHRNRLLHDGDYLSDHEQSTSEFTIESRIVGLINVMALKLMGYSGLVHAPTEKEDYRMI